MGLGGTGLRALLHLKKEKFKLGDSTRFLAFDTNTPLQDFELDGVKIENNEFIHIGNFQTKDYLHSLSKTPHINYRFPENLQPIHIEHGANGIRPFGRLAFFNNCEKIKAAIQKTIDDIGRVVDVYIITSLCGETGSGIFGDMAYLVRHILKEKNIDGNVDGLLLLPEVFDTKMPLNERTRANCYAALKDLHFFMKPQQFEAENTPNLNIISTSNPFNHCYLFDGTNKGRLVLSNIDKANDFYSNKRTSDLLEVNECTQPIDSNSNDEVTKDISYLFETFKLLEKNKEFKGKMIEYHDLGDYVRSFMREGNNGKGYTRAELSNITNIHYNYFGDILQNNRIHRDEILDQLAQIPGADKDLIYMLAGRWPKSIPRGKKTLEILREYYELEEPNIPCTLENREFANMSFNDYIKMRRRELKLSQPQVAESTGISRGYYNQLERGDYTPTAPVIKGLSDILKVDAGFLVSLDFPQKNK